MAAGWFADVTKEIETRVEAMGFEVVEFDLAGTSRRPILRLRVDLPDSRPGAGITVGDCARVSRALEPWLDERTDLPERYVLEVSSPGVERPLVRPRDWVRFAGSEVAVKVRRPVEGRGGRLQGELVGVEEGEAGPTVRLRMKNGEELLVSMEAIAEARLVHRWG